MIYDIPYKVRAVWTGKMNGEDRALFLAGKNLYTHNFSTKHNTKLGSVESFDTKADFFVYNGLLYLIDGIQIYEVSSGTPKTPHGYVPLIGKNWRDSKIGEIYEPRNLLNNKGRISYVIGDPATSFLKTDAQISSVDAIYVNGERIEESRYGITAMPRTVGVSGLEANDYVEMYFTYAENANEEEIARLKSCTNAVVFGGAASMRPFLWGADDPTLIISSGYVGKTQLLDSQRVYPESDALYFPAGYEFKVGTSGSPITAISRNYDRLLIFNDHEVWMADTSVTGIEELPVLNINSPCGVSSANGATLLGNTLYTISVNGIMEWSSSYNELNEFHTRCISTPIHDLLPDDVYTNGMIFADIRENRILVTSPSLKGIVWVWYEKLDSWVRLDLGLTVNHFFSTPKDIGFTNDSNVYAFDESKYEDHNGREIVGKFEGKLTDFDKYGNKRVFSAAVRCDGEVTVECLFDNDTSPSVSLTMSAHGHESVRRRINARRFGTLRPAITAGGNERQVIHSLRLWPE